MAYIFLAIAVIFGIVYLIKVLKSKNLLAKAIEAKMQGDDKTAINLFKEALKFSNETPDREMEILSYMKRIYANHNVEYDFADYNVLIDQYNVLKKKNSNKAMREMGEVNNLKTQLIEKMPDIE